MTVPGIDIPAALAVVAAVGDSSRFSSPDRLVAYLGVNPRTLQTVDGPAVYGRIAKADRHRPAACSSRRPSLPRAPSVMPKR